MVKSSRVVGVCVAFLASTASALSLSTPITQRAESMNTQLTTFGLQSRDPIVMMPAVQQVPVKTDGPAVLERPVAEKQQTREPVKKKKSVGGAGWEVRIYNDGMNTREHVARSLVQITGLSEVAAYQTMMQAHQNGMAVVGRWIYERAEMYRDALKKNGILCDMIPVDDEN